MAGLSAKILRLAEGRVSAPFAVPTDPGLRGRVGEPCGRAWLSCYGV